MFSTSFLSDDADSSMWAPLPRPHFKMFLLYCHLFSIPVQNHPLATLPQRRLYNQGPRSPTFSVSCGERALSLRWGTPYVRGKRDTSGTSSTLRTQPWSSRASKRPGISHCPRETSLETAARMQKSFSGVKVRQTSLHVSELQFRHQQGTEASEGVTIKTERHFVLFKRNTPRNEVP